MSEEYQIIEIPTFLEEEELLPFYTTAGASGADVKAHIKDPISLLPGQSVLIPTGLRMAIPKGYEIQVRPRSGLALQHQITVLNTPGTIDADYRGEIKIILINHGLQIFTVLPGMRIAQLVLAPVLRAHFLPNSNLNATERGSGGFGHTGFAPQTLNIFDYMSPQLVLFSDAQMRDEVLAQLVHHIYQQGKLKDEDAFYQAILERERIVSTGIGMGVAIPHAKLPFYDHFFIALGILQKPVDWLSLDRSPVRLVFMIGGPDDKPTEYLQLLSGLTQAIKKDELRKQLLELRKQPLTLQKSSAIIELFKTI
jgi:deoxyuridine 5'-triphosphate nucleotidohydrolase